MSTRYIFIDGIIQEVTWLSSAEFDNGEQYEVVHLKGKTIKCIEPTFNSRYECFKFYKKKLEEELMKLEESFNDN